MSGITSETSLILPTRWSALSKSDGFRNRFSSAEERTAQGASTGTAAGGMHQIVCDGMKRTLAERLSPGASTMHGRIREVAQ
ncbi:hypothetical protein MPLA_1800082 [Mesorhizobium sp. ORS 3359]|nr:hypothetical protein MPLA_1800082 [Mesorhizobium sp. ORS 3359]